MRFPELLAIASGVRCEGLGRCVLCGSPANEPFDLPDSFTTIDTLAVPGSLVRCAGCQLAMQESGIADYPDGTQYSFTKAFRRMCSWVVTAHRVTAATKAHIAYLRGVCLDPPDPPFGISIAVSGQRQVLYRGVVNRQRDPLCVTLEGEPIYYTLEALRSRLTLCGKLVASTGKPALTEPVSAGFAYRVCERYHDGESMVMEWSRVQMEPLSRLAAFLVPAKDEAQIEHPRDGHDDVPPTSGGADRSDQKDRRGRRTKHQGRSEATLFGDV